MTDKVIDFYLNRYVIFGLFLYALSALLYIKALQYIKVSVAFPSQSIAYIFVALYAVFYFFGIFIIKTNYGTIFFQNESSRKKRHS